MSPQAMLSGRISIFLVCFSELQRGSNADQQPSKYTPKNCYDLDEAADEEGYHCDFYIEDDCGVADSFKFKSAEMCCICGGGTNGPDRTCFDADVSGHMDGGGYSCAMYAPDDCGKHDNGNFNSANLCCACGGGFGYKLERLAPVVPIAPRRRRAIITTPMPIVPSEFAPNECYDTDTDGDSAGYRCDFYIEDDCGLFDEGSFDSKQQCCACGGGSRGPDRKCYDIDGVEVDEQGYHCDFYIADDCNTADTDRFDSKKVCCICGGGSGVPPTTTTTTRGPDAGPTHKPLPPGTCPETEEEILLNNGCPLDFGPRKGANPHICKSGGCYSADRYKFCPHGLCDAPSEALEKHGFTMPTTTTAPPCPEEYDLIISNGGCCRDYEPPCEFGRLCSTGGCLKNEWSDRCQGNFCDAVSVALTKRDFAIPSTTTPVPVTTPPPLVIPDNLLKPLGPKSGVCPTTTEDIRENNGCCLDFGTEKCEDHHICLSGGCYATGMRGKLQWSMKPCILGLCEGPLQVLAHNGVALWNSSSSTWKPWADWTSSCPQTSDEIKRNGGCVGRQNRLCRTGGCFDARFDDACEAGLCPAVKDALQDIVIADAL